VFKGGTSLRLVYFEKYRYSADLDFTVVGGGIDAALAALAKVVAAAKEHAGFPYLDELHLLFNAIAVAKHLDPGTFAEKFEERIERYRRAWLGEMARHLVEPPPFGEVERIVRRHLRGAGYLTT